jgi:hypothetical protein
MTLQHRISVFNKWQLARKDNRVASLAARYVYEDRWGGQMGWNKAWRGSDSVYGESVYTSRIELLGLYQLPFRERIFAQLSYNMHDQDSRYGVTSYIARQQVGFAQELTQVVEAAVASGAADDPVVRDLLVRQWAELRAMRWNALRTLGSSADRSAPSVAKLLWGRWHQRLGELAMRVRGPGAAVGPREWSAGAPYELDALQHLFLFSRADTIYGGSDEIQRTIIAERVLGLPREAKG